MKRIGVVILWSFLFLALLLAMDQVLLRESLPIPGYPAVRQFYLDFRSRLLAGAEKTPVKMAAPRQVPTAPPSSRASATPAERTPRYLYEDARGELQFADSLKEIPPPLRKSARRLAR